MEEGSSTIGNPTTLAAPVTDVGLTWPPAAAGEAGTSELASMPMPGVPRLPPAPRVPSNGRPARAVTLVDQVVVGSAHPSPADKRRPRGRRIVTSLTFVLVVGGATAVIVFAGRGSDGSDRALSAGSSQTVAPTPTSLMDAGTAPLSTADPATTETTTLLAAAPAASAEPMVVVPTAPPIPSFVEPVQSSTVSNVVPAITAFDFANDPYYQQVERCRAEEGTVFAALQAFVYGTGAHPESPDSLAEIGRLEPHPQGWNARWAFDYTEEGIYVVPVPGGECDV